MAAKILLVEDDNNLREIYEARLQAEGYTIVTAKDGEEALVVAKAERPNLVISDVMMPRISGFEMLDILRNTDDLRDTKVIMLTALGQADDKTRASSLGADRYLVKSQVTLEDIVKSAHELIGDMPAAPEAPAAPAAPAPPATPTPPPMMPTTPQPVLAKTEPPAAISSPAPVMPGMMPAAPVPPQPALGSMMSASPAAAPMTPLAPPPVPPQPVVIPAAPAPTALASKSETAALSASPTEAQEKATIDAQIDNFVKTAQAAPEVAPTDPATASKATQDDAVLATAMNDLAASVPPQTAQDLPAAPVDSAAAVVAPATPPAPTPPAVSAPEPAPAVQSNTGSVRIANKKVIEPLNSTPKLALDELVAREEAKNIISSGYNPAGAVVSSDPASPATPMPAPAPMPQAGNVFSPPASPQPPQHMGGPDPNNIAL